MAHLIQLSIDATKISKSRMKDGKYVNLVISVNDETNEWGKNVSVYEEQTKEERDAKEKRNYIGSGKVVWSDNKLPQVVESGTKKPVETKKEEELPF